MDFVDLPLETILVEKRKMNQSEYSMPLMEARALIPCMKVKMKERKDV